MKKLHSHPSPAMRLLTSLIGMLFLFSMVAAQLPYCQCGILCLHGESALAKAGSEASDPAEKGCCPSRGQDDTAPASPVPDEAPCDESEGCGCTVEINSTSDFPTAPIPFVVSSVDYHPELAASSDATPFVARRAGIEDAPRWRPARGSPLPTRSLHVLNAVYII